MYLNEKAKKAPEASIGTSIQNLSEMDSDEELEFIKSKIGKKPIYSKKIDTRIRGRGNPFLSRKRICTMEDIDKKIMGM